MFIYFYSLDKWGKRHFDLFISKFTALFCVLNFKFVGNQLIFIFIVLFKKTRICQLNLKYIMAQILKSTTTN